MRRAFGFAVVLGAVLIPSLAAAQARCTRAELQGAVDRYIAAQTTGRPSGLNLASAAKYVENAKDTAIDRGILQTPLKIDFHRSLLDVEACQTFTEVIVTDSQHPYVLGVRMKTAAGRIAEIEAFVTDKDDWLFNADNYLKYSSAENWGVIPTDARDSRATLVAAANAYEDRFFNDSVAVPLGTPCNRLEGGMRTGKGRPDDSCSGGFPTGMPVANRRFVVDPDIGSVVALSEFSVNRLPDSHLFRLEKGKVRYVHTLTVCTLPNCGFPVRAPSGAQ